MGCLDPLRAEQIEALGPEQPNLPSGPLHRAGQPCLLCHSEGGRSTPFGVAGTVYQTQHAQSPAAGVAVSLTDSARNSYVAYTNCAGNFFVVSSEFQPVMPLWVSLSTTDVQIDMESPMHKDGDCATCHTRSVSSQSVGPVFLSAILGPGMTPMQDVCKGQRR